eukprot:2529083-Rhodomonas_salina.1
MAGGPGRIPARIRAYRPRIRSAWSEAPPISRRGGSAPTVFLSSTVAGMTLRSAISHPYPPSPGISLPV